ncbi:hypothetical protein AsAng_0037020 [Aureispira anguillae]|uniref:Uncharacterized protein n=1 Tax=Aureispira anguillae TaxID=2864201 RepID=A0A915YGZ4_9BACT|nr:hypothetical protein AsAng_0037020 [Aureispira anguillae]
MTFYFLKLLPFYFFSNPYIFYLRLFFPTSTIFTHKTLQTN